MTQAEYRTLVAEALGQYDAEVDAAKHRLNRALEAIDEAFYYPLEEDEDDGGLGEDVLVEFPSEKP